MKKINKIFTIINILLLCIILLLVGTNLVNAQPSSGNPPIIPPGCNNPVPGIKNPNCPNDVPLPGLAYLMITGGGYAIYKLKKRSKDD